ncbi:hypothetical protein FJY69_05250, partial [candidate division WOR-3 bacterium]|nr:hypothetical protein [candidate division WOR-3 bacterium]
PSWTATTGTYTATCFASIADDEVRGNDTVAALFHVVADTWVKMFEVYGGGGLQGGAALATVDSNQIFCITGKMNFFAKYLVRENLWKTRTSTPSNSFAGTIAYAGGNHLYVLRGGGSRSFWRYSIPYNYWEVRCNAPDRTGNGASLAWAGGSYLYALRGFDKRDFWAYSMSGNAWTQKAQTPAKVGSGGALVWGGGDSLFALRGNNKRDFWLYRISANQWQARDSAPVAAGSGADLAYNPLTKKIYAFFGGNTRYFYVYNIATNTWSARCLAPAPVRTGGCLTYCDYSIFGGVGLGRNDDFWRYSPPVGGDEGEGGLPSEDQAKMFPEGPAIREAGPSDGPGDILTLSLADKYTPRFSPDGGFISFTASDSMRGCNSLYKIPAGGGEPSPLTPESDSTTYEDPVWSPDNCWLAASGDSGLYKLSSDGSQQLLLSRGLVSDARWSDGNEWLTFTKWDTLANVQRLYKVNSSGTAETCLAPDFDGYLQPRPLGDSEAICVKLKDEVYQVCRVTPDAGLETWLTSDYMQNSDVQLSPDGQWVTYEKLDESGYWQVYKMRIDGSEETRLSDGTCPCLTPVFSPDNQNVAYTKWPVDSTGSYEYSQICTRPAASVGVETALTEADALRANPSWSPDCAYIIYEQEVPAGGSDRKPRKYRQIGRVRTKLRFAGTSDAQALPKRFLLYQNRPNPFSARTAIRYAVPWRSYVEMVVFDVTGRMVNRLVSAEQKPGYYTAVWRGEDSRGRRLPSGAYYYVLRADKKVLQKRMLLVR